MALLRVLEGEITLGRLEGGEITRGVPAVPAVPGGGGGAPGGGGEMVEMFLMLVKFSLLTTLTMDNPLARAREAVSGRTDKSWLIGGTLISLGGVVSAKAPNEGRGGRRGVEGAFLSSGVGDDRDGLFPDSGVGEALGFAFFSGVGVGAALGGGLVMV